MKKRNFLLSLSFVFLSFFILGLGITSDPDKKSTIKNDNSVYPVVVQGPQLSSPLSTLNESFESTTFPPTGWTKITPTSAAGYNRQTNGTTPVPGFSGGYITVPTGGGSAVAFCNYITGNASGGTSGVCNQWLVTPQITNVQANDSLSFWVRKFGSYADNFIIRISTTTATVNAMTIRIDSLGNSASDSGWVQKKYRLGDFVTTGSNIYIGFQEWCADVSTDAASYSLDLVKITITTGITNINSEIPKTYNLSQNYPNPFNPVTVINFSLPKTGLVTLKVYNALGNEVKSLVNEIKGAGNYSVNFNASELSSGIYFYKLESNGFVGTKKMMLVK